MIIDRENPRFGEMQNVKRRFFALRNGIIADRLRHSGDPHRIIFGLTVSQLVEVAEATPHSHSLATMLWQNDSTRESRLLAPMIMPRDTFSREDADSWIMSLKNNEEADILCHRLLRHLVYADDFMADEKYADVLDGYFALRLCFNLLNREPHKRSEQAHALATRYLGSDNAIVRHTAQAIMDEAEFWLSEDQEKE